MTKVRRIPVIVATVLLSIGVVSAASPAQANDTSWGRGQGFVSFK